MTMRKMIAALAVCGGVLCGAGRADADEIVLENAEVRAVVCPGESARLVSLTDKVSGRELLDSSIGACREVFPAKQYPGMFAKLRYAVVRSDKAGAVLSARLQDASKGYDFTLEKTYGLDGKSVSVSVSVQNNGAEELLRSARAVASRP